MPKLSEQEVAPILKAVRQKHGRYFWYGWTEDVGVYAEFLGGNKSERIHIFQNHRKLPRFSDKNRTVYVRETGGELRVLNPF